MTLWLYPWQMAEVTKEKLEFHCKKQLGWKSRTHKNTSGIQKALIMFSMGIFFLCLLLSSVSVAAKEECTGYCCWLSLFLGFNIHKKPQTLTTWIFISGVQFYFVFGEKVFGNIGLTKEPFPTVCQLSKGLFIFSDKFLLVKSSLSGLWRSFFLSFSMLPNTPWSVYLQNTDTASLLPPPLVFPVGRFPLPLTIREVKVWGLKKRYSAQLCILKIDNTHCNKQVIILKDKWLDNPWKLFQTLHSTLQVRWIECQFSDYDTYGMRHYKSVTANRCLWKQKKSQTTSQFPSNILKHGHESSCFLHIPIAK